MKALLARELRQLAPLGLFLLLCNLLGYATLLAFARVDEVGFAGWCGQSCREGVPVIEALMLAVTGLLATYRLFAVERDQGTFAFLRALPVSRDAIFVSKCLAAWLLVVILQVIAHLLIVLFLALNPESMTGRAYPGVQMTLLLAIGFFAFVVVSHAVLLSWFRTAGLVIYGVYLLTVVTIESRRGSAGSWSLLRMLEIEFDGQALLLHWAAIGTQGIAALFILIVGRALWSRQSAHASGDGVTATHARWLIPIGTLAGLAVMALSISGLVAKRHEPADALAIEQRTTNYRFVYSEGSDAVRELIADHADNDYRRIASLLGAHRHPIIQANLMDKSAHAGGLASWKRVNVDVSGGQDLQTLRRVLAHETTHVFQAVESAQALRYTYNEVRFFVEGMAQYIAQEIASDDKTRQYNWEMAAVAWHRQDIRFGHLADNREFAARFDWNLFYAIGDIWTDTLLRVCGPPVLGDILRATARAGAPRGIRGDAFWRDTLAAVDCDLDAVNARWREQMQVLYEAANLNAFPEYREVSARRHARTDAVTVTAQLPVLLNSGLPSQHFIRIGRTQKLANEVDRVIKGSAGTILNGVSEVTFVVPTRLIDGDRFRYQLGYHPGAGLSLYFDRWRNGSVRD